MAVEILFSAPQVPEDSQLGISTRILRPELPDEPGTSHFATQVIMHFNEGRLHQEVVINCVSEDSGAVYITPPGSSQQPLLEGFKAADIAEGTPPFKRTIIDKEGIGFEIDVRHCNPKTRIYN